MLVDRKKEKKKRYNKHLILIRLNERWLFVRYNGASTSPIMPHTQHTAKPSYQKL